MCQTSSRLINTDVVRQLVAVIGEAEDDEGGSASNAIPLYRYRCGKGEESAGFKKEVRVPLQAGMVANNRKVVLRGVVKNQSEVPVGRARLLVHWKEAEGQLDLLPRHCQCGDKGIMSVDSLATALVNIPPTTWAHLTMWVLPPSLVISLLPRRIRLYGWMSGLLERTARETEALLCRDAPFHSTQEQETTDENTSQFLRGS